MLNGNWSIFLFELIILPVTDSKKGAARPGIGLSSKAVSALTHLVGTCREAQDAGQLGIC